MLAKQYCENCNSPKKRYNPKQTQEEKDFSETHKLSDKELSKFMAESKAELKRQADLERKSFEKLLYEELLDPNADYRSQLNKDGIKQKKIKLTKKKYEEMDDEEIHRLRKKLETKQWKYCKFDPTRTYTTREKYGY